MQPHILVFSSDTKTLDVLTQIFDEFAVTFDHCHELFATTTRFATEPFGVILVDCDDVQNASLVFDNVRGSELNRNAMTVAIVDGKAGVPTAFRLGAKLVMSKPLSLEQARTTLRNALASQRRDPKEPQHALPEPSPMPPVKVEPQISEPVAAPAPDLLAPPASALATAAFEDEHVSVEVQPTTSVTSAGAATARAPIQAKVEVVEPPQPPIACEKPVQPVVEIAVASPVVASAMSNESKAPAVASDSSPSFGILQAHERRTSPLVVAAFACIAVVAVGATAWKMLPNQRNQVLGLLPHSQSSQKPVPVTSVPVAPSATAASANPAPVVETPAAAAQEPAVPLAQGFQDGDTTAATKNTAKPSATTGADEAASPIIVAAEIADSHITHRPNPWYPTRARHAHIRGDVVLTANVATDGTVQSTDVVNGDPALTLAAQECVKQWIFQPYFKDGQASAFQTQVTVTFPPVAASPVN